ncbi:N-acetylglucosamine phosphatase [Dimargaris cristalligena]|uniref:4-nitrophenylphosphatase n=1 Tax=Dimargaris cristalligena TaxID=215637 RepID=A0A4P9ZZI2_9FUNG|nr:N-acetylglucosamine phosphatase [Dimargaris cristalligena]|eukprot:RKP39153.1 N-acetylglucosamine phosphatase [Dimargaris cristalligena]
MGRERLAFIRDKKGFICDMDGVIYHGDTLLPGVKEFIEWLKNEEKQFIFLTNNSAPTPRELREKMLRLGVDVAENHFYTSGIATAKFLKSQVPDGSCYVIGEAGLTHTLYEHGFTMNDKNPDFVVVGEGTSLNYDKMAKAVKLVNQGAKLIATNPDSNGPGPGGIIIPATGAFVSGIELASGHKAFMCGKPSSLMMSYAQQILGTRREDTCIIGDRMDTDILAGIYSEIHPVLVMSGVTKTTEAMEEFAYQPYLVLDGVKDIPLERESS